MLAKMNLWKSEIIADIKLLHKFRAKHFLTNNCDLEIL